jgi:glycosyltransferase involved in cell wall biosynthesis
MTGIGYGGASKSLLLLLKSLKKYSDIEAFVFAPFSKSPEIKNEIEKNCNKLIIKSYPHINANQAYLTKKREFKKNINTNHDELISQIYNLSPDIIHLNSTTLAYLIRPLKEKNPNTKLIVHLREVLRNPKSNEIAKFLVSEIQNCADFRIAISDNELIPFGSIKFSTILPNPVDFTEIKIEGTQKPNNMSNDNIKIGMMSTFHHSKGHMNYLEALSLLNQKLNTKFTGIILGFKEPSRNLRYYVKKIFQKDFYTNINKYIIKNKLSHKVQLIEQTNSVYGFLNSLDIYIRPSNAGDPWGRDIIEAMAMGKVIIATGNSEFFIENGKTGYLIPPFQPTILADKITDLINNPIRRRDFGEAGYKKIRLMCDLNNYGKSLYELYKNLLIYKN